jgi:hypothetical protein
MNLMSPPRITLAQAAALTRLAAAFGPLAFLDRTPADAPVQTPSYPTAA